MRMSIPIRKDTVTLSVFGSVKAAFMMDTLPPKSSPFKHIRDRLFGSQALFGELYSTSAVIRTTIWAVCHFAFYFAQQIAELLAPLLLVVGIGWHLLPSLVNAVAESTTSADPQARNIILHVTSTIPTQLVLNGHVFTPRSLIFDGLLLMSLAAIGATLSALSARNM